MEQANEQMGDNEIQHQLMTTAEASSYLGVSLNLLQKWRSRNVGPKYFKYGGANSAAIRYDRADVEAYRRSHMIPTRPTRETNA